MKWWTWDSNPSPLKPEFVLVAPSHGSHTRSLCVMQCGDTAQQTYKTLKPDGHVSALGSEDTSPLGCVALDLHVSEPRAPPPLKWAQEY